MFQSKMFTTFQDQFRKSEITMTDNGVGVSTVLLYDNISRNLNEKKHIVRLFKQIAQNIKKAHGNLH